MSDDPLATVLNQLLGGFVSLGTRLTINMLSDIFEAETQHVTDVNIVRIVLEYADLKETKRGATAPPTPPSVKYAVNSQYVKVGEKALVRNDIDALLHLRRFLLETVPPMCTTLGCTDQILSDNSVLVAENHYLKQKLQEVESVLPFAHKMAQFNSSESVQSLSYALQQMYLASVFASELDLPKRRESSSPKKKECADQMSTGNFTPTSPTTTTTTSQEPILNPTQLTENPEYQLKTDDRPKDLSSKKGQKSNSQKKSELPCFIMRNIGKCRFGSKCKYSHDPAVLNRDLPPAERADLVQEQLAQMYTTCAAVHKQKVYWKKRFNAAKRKVKKETMPPRTSGRR